MNAFDTNILVYACDKSDPERRRISTQLIRETRDGVMPWQVCCEFIAASRKLAKQGFTANDAWKQLAELIRAFPLILPDQVVLDRARALHVENQWSFWDALIVAACLESGVQRLYSEDLPGRIAPGNLEIINPFA